jgi:GDP-L-fucose synthase
MFNESTNMLTKTGTRVALLGGAGFAGRNVFNALCASGITVRVFSRKTGCNLLDLPTAWEKLNSFCPDIIINCAAHVGSVNYVTDFAADVVDVNMRIILNTYKIAQQMKKVIVINPIANCGYPGTMDIYEERGLWNGPIHPSVLSYGSTRRMMLVLSQCYFNQYGVHSVNLIVPNMFGPYDSTNPNKTHALNALIIKFVHAEKDCLPEVEVWGTGKPIREWLYVKDFAEFVRHVIESKEYLPEPVNIAQNCGYSVSEIVNIIKSQVGFAGEITYNKRYQDGSPKKVMDDRYFRQRFPDFKFTDFETGIMETIEFYKGIL